MALSLSNTDAFEWFLSKADVHEYRSFDVLFYDGFMWTEPWRTARHYRNILSWLDY